MVSQKHLLWAVTRLASDSWWQDVHDKIQKKKKRKKNRREAIKEFGGIIFKIPSRRPDLNHIENVFNLTAEMLNREAVKKMKPMKHSLNFQLVSREH